MIYFSQGYNNFSSLNDTGKICRRSTRKGNGNEDEDEDEDILEERASTERESRRNYAQTWQKKKKEIEKNVRSARLTVCLARRQRVSSLKS